jgi:hypothetical protein
MMASDVSLAEEDDDAPSRPGCPTPIEIQIESLKALAPGWYDDTSPAYEPAALDWLTRLLKGLLDGFRLPTPYLYPTPEGLARAEWSAPHWEIIATIDLATRSAEVLAARVDSDEIHELPVAFTEPGAESALGRFLVDHVLAQ